MKIRTVFIYAFLLLGALIFAWPFIWMATTSAKLERELFSDRPARLPQSPRPVLQSPYVDERLFENAEGPRREETLQLIQATLRSGAYSWPNDVDRDRLIVQTARGIYQQLAGTMPSGFWTGPTSDLDQRIQRLITADLMTDMANRLRRTFAIGQLRIRSYDLQENSW
jgi:ABC-type glycerol-3-phosphate transport system permease component